jgi:hypothetical protein
MIGFKNMDKFDFFFIIEGDDIVFSPLRSENNLFINEYILN